MPFLKIKHGYGPGLKIGCDPEFLLIRQNGSKEWIAREWEGPEGEFGTDGGSCYLGEIRPRAGSPSSVTSDIRTIIRHVRELYPEHRLVAGGGSAFDTHTGGHIHFNIDVKGDGPYRGFQRVLDRFLGRPLKAMIGGQRRTSSYGHESDCRWKDHGFEYRTPPSWIADPLLTEAILSVAARLVELGMQSRGIKKSMGEDGIATPEEYDALVPDDRPSFRIQVARFKDYVFGGFDLATDDAFERWLAPVPYEFRPGCMINLRELGAQLAAPRSDARISMAPDFVGVLGRETELASRAGRITIFNDHDEMSAHRMYLPIDRLRIYTGSYTSVPFVVERSARRGRSNGRAIRLKDDVLYVSDELRGMFRKPRGMKIKFVRIFDTDHSEPIIWIPNGNPLQPVHIMERLLSRPRRTRRLTRA